MGMTRGLFREIGDTKRITHAKMGIINDRISRDITEAERLRRGGKNTQNSTRKGLSDSEYHNGVVTYLEPDILECEAKWALGFITMNKASGGDEIPAELCQILKDDTVEVLQSICQQIWKTQQWPQNWKRSIFIPIPKKSHTKEYSNCHTIALISHVVKVMIKDL